MHLDITNRYVVPHPDKVGWSRVFYSVEVNMFDWVPKFVTDFMSSKALTDATGWVKKYSELDSKKKNGGRDSETEFKTQNGSRGMNDKTKVSFANILKNYLYQDVFDLVVGGSGDKILEVEKETNIKENTNLEEKNNLSWIEIVCLYCIGAISTYTFHRFLSNM